MRATRGRVGTGSTFCRTGKADMFRVLLVNMPFFNLRWPNLGLGLLKAALAKESGVSCEVAYFNFDFAERVGEELYTWIADNFAFVLGGERLFARHYFGKELPTDRDYYERILKAADPELTEQEFQDFLFVQEQVAAFLEQVGEAVAWEQYELVGFSTSFQQTLASLCLARLVKQRAPRTTVVFGGAACEDVMGLELLRRFSQIDYVCAGEADESFPRLVRELAAGGQATNIPGVWSRERVVRKQERSGAAWEAVEAVRVSNLDALPFPNFDEYFNRLQSSSVALSEPLLFFESSRGCWWGEKHHCVFCGLNGTGLKFRSKSPERVLEELTWLSKRYNVHWLCAADNIFDFHYYRTLLPLLQEARLDLRFIYEVKPSLSRQQAEALVAAGLSGVQLGIETFSTPILKLAEKGATAVQNLQALKWFSELNVQVEWNFLFGFPNEPPEEYARLAELLPLLVHLTPPLAVGRVRPDRFSPYFNQPERYGIRNLRPHRAFRYVYPFSEAVLRRLAYYHEFDFADGREPLSYAARAVQAVQLWQQAEGQASLSWTEPTNDTLVIHDTRPCAVQFQTWLTGPWAFLYKLCDTGRPFPYILKAVERRVPEVTVEQLERFLQKMLDLRLMVQLDGRYLSLAVAAEPHAALKAEALKSEGREPEVE